MVGSFTSLSFLRITKTSPTSMPSPAPAASVSVLPETSATAVSDSRGCGLQRFHFGVEYFIQLIDAIHSGLANNGFGEIGAAHIHLAAATALAPQAAQATDHAALADRLAARFSRIHYFSAFGVDQLIVDGHYGFVFLFAELDSTKTSWKNAAATDCLRFYRPARRSRYRR